MGLGSITNVLVTRDALNEAPVARSGAPLRFRLCPAPAPVPAPSLAAGLCRGSRIVIFWASFLSTPGILAKLALYCARERRALSYPSVECKGLREAERGAPGKAWMKGIGNSDLKFHSVTRGCKSHPSARRSPGGGESCIRYATHVGRYRMKRR